MNKIEIEVPINVRYISEWDDFNTDLLKGHSVINKTITGCGFTHYCLTNNIPTILCSPRKFLLENKHEQLPDTYLVINEGEKTISIDNELDKNQLDEDFSNILFIQNNLRSYIFNCQVSNIAPKILVTYDSLGHILSVLGETIKYYSVIVDEFQNIFMDASFKADTELNFVDILQSCPNVTYLSATPYIEEYLNELDEFKLLPYYELKWHPDRLQTIKVDLKKTFNISKEVDLIVNDYLNSDFPEKVDENGIIHQSREVVFYTNSVKLITSTIKRNNLKPDQVNIICADTSKNKKQLEKIGFKIGKAPLKDQPHKMFTFCTRTTYAGADFYSTNALSVIISDCKIDSLSTDIRMDFPQIMGRQRLKNNIFRDECIFIFKLSDSSITMEEFEKLKAEKIKYSEKDLENYRLLQENRGYCDNLLTDIRTRIRTYNYKGDYTGISSRDGRPIINKLVMLAEKRAFELRSDVYKNEIQVYNEFSKISSESLSFDDYNTKLQILNDLKEKYRRSGSFEDRMRAVCDILLDPKWSSHIHISDFYWLPIKYRNLLNLVGPEKIRATGHIESIIKKELQQKSMISSIGSELVSKIIIGNRYTLKDLKNLIGLVYQSLGIDKTAKATDILEFFEVRECLITEKDSGKRVKGYEILKIK